MSADEHDGSPVSSAQAPPATDQALFGLRPPREPWEEIVEMFDDGDDDTLTSVEFALNDPASVVAAVRVGLAVVRSIAQALGQVRVLADPGGVGGGPARLVQAVEHVIALAGRAGALSERLDAIETRHAAAADGSTASSVPVAVAASSTAGLFDLLAEVLPARPGLRQNTDQWADYVARVEVGRQIVRWAREGQET